MPEHWEVRMDCTLSTTSQPKNRLRLTDLFIFVPQGQKWEELGKHAMQVRNAGCVVPTGLQVSLFGCLLKILEDLKIVEEEDRHQESPVMTLQIAPHLISYPNLCWTSTQQC